jgi:hypothetical protein
LLYDLPASEDVFAALLFVLASDLVFGSLLDPRHDLSASTSNFGIGSQARVDAAGPAGKAVVTRLSKLQRELAERSFALAATKPSSDCAGDLWICAVGGSEAVERMSWGLPVSEPDIEHIGRSTRVWTMAPFCGPERA